jgi:O-methyltransferase/aklanonic acid methyltransferase
MAAARVVKSKDLFPAVFSRHAAAYQQRLDGIMARGEARGRMRVIELAGAAPGMRILDLACGPGILSRPLAELVAPDGEIVGVDLAAGMIERARALQIANARFEVMDIESLAFDDSTFDAVVCGHGLQFAPDLGRALREARRVLRDGGRLAASMPVTTVSESVWSLLDSVVDRWLPPAPEVVDQQPTRAVVEDARALRQAVLDAGFTSARVEVVEEVVHWESAESLVAMFMGWWNWAVRLEGMDAGARQAFMDEATATLKREHPGTIETTGRNHVLLAMKA